MPKAIKKVKKEEVKVKKPVEEKINDCGTKDVYDENNPYGE